MAPPLDGARLSRLFDDLFPIMRSISGDGLIESIRLLQQFMPLQVETVPSGSRVFDWTVPPEWKFRAARLTAPNGETVVDAADNTLHVLNYSEPVDLIVSREQLEKHLYSLPDQPDAIPYVTSYYKRHWGFCLTENQRRALPYGTYHALIDSDFDDTGGVPFAQCVLEGESTAEILLTSYLCHPSLANNELSGPLTLLGLHDRLSRWPKRRYTYRFVVNPETIGSLCFLSRYGDHLKSHMAGGLVLNCTGGPSPSLSYKFSRSGDSVFDRLAQRLSAEAGSKDLGMPLVTRPFTPVNGSDERQYCSPGFNLPVGQFARTVYLEYPGYHNSLDTKEFMGIDNLVETIDALERFLALGEIAGTYINQSPHGEPQLGKRNLYPSESWTKAYLDQSTDSVFDHRRLLDQMLIILNYSDGEYDMLKIADICETSLPSLRPAIEILEREGLLKLARP